MLDAFDLDFYTDTVTVTPMDGSLDEAGAPQWTDSDPPTSHIASVQKAARLSSSKLTPMALGGVDMESQYDYIVHFQSDPGSVSVGQRITWTTYRNGLVFAVPIVLTAIQALTPANAAVVWTVTCRRIA